MEVKQKEIYTLKIHRRHLYTKSKYNLPKRKCMQVNGGVFALAHPAPNYPMLPIFYHEQGSAVRKGPEGIS